MAELPSYFRRFLQEIRPTPAQREEARRAVTTLRERLQADEGLAEIYVADFLQGSYRRATAVRPAEDQRSDVDLVVVTNLDSAEVKPAEAQEVFIPFLDRYYESKYERQGRSLGITLSTIELDLVVTAAPSEVMRQAVSWDAVRSLASPEEVSDWRLNEWWVSEENRELLDAPARLRKAQQAASWRSEPLQIPNREAAEWELTDPLTQIAWTFEKSGRTNRHYVNVVKALKWWRRTQHPQPKHPKGYPLEHIIGDCCPDAIGSVAVGVTETLEAIVRSFVTEVASHQVPYCRDRGLDQNVLKRISADEFRAFYEQAVAAAELARSALDESDSGRSAELWQRLFGAKFPAGDGGSGSGEEGGPTTSGFSERKRPSGFERERFG